MHTISSSASIGRDVVFDVARLSIGQGVVVEDGTAIRGDEIVLADGAHVGCNVAISADRFSVGVGGRIEDDCVVGALGGRRAELIELGDRFFLGAASKLLMPTFLAGDYVSIHNHLLANGLEPCIVGHNSWIGQNCVLNSNSQLTIGNNVGIGAYSSIYTHGFFGERLEGCEVFDVAPVTIEDDAWLVGAYNVVSPGVTIGRRAIVLPSSVVSRDVAPESCVAGAPARDMTDRIRPFRAVGLEEKLALMKRFVEEYAISCHSSPAPTAHGFEVDCADGGTRVVEVRESILTGDYAEDREGAVYVASNTARMHFAGVTVFDLSDKTYGKLGTDFEAKLISFMNSYRARFVPAERPRIAPLSAALASQDPAARSTAP